MPKADSPVTVMFSREEMERLETLAQLRGTSLDDLVHDAIEQNLLRPSAAERTAAVRQMAALSLPVADPDQMERESVDDGSLA